SIDTRHNCSFRPAHRTNSATPSLPIFLADICGPSFPPCGIFRFVYNLRQTAAADSLCLHRANRIPRIPPRVTHDLWLAVAIYADKIELIVEASRRTRHHLTRDPRLRSMHSRMKRREVRMWFAYQNWAITAAAAVVTFLLLVLTGRQGIPSKWVT